MHSPSSFQKIPSMDEVLARLNDTLISVRLVSDDTRKAVNDTFSSGVQEIEYFKYSTEVNIQPLHSPTSGNTCILV